MTGRSRGGLAHGHDQHRDRHDRRHDRHPEHGADVAREQDHQPDGCERAEHRADGVERLAQSVRGDEPSYLDFGVGAFNAVFRHGQPATAEGRIEFRYGEKLFYIGPAVGLLANARGGVFGYGGLYSDIAFGRFILTPLAGLGG